MPRASNFLDTAIAQKDPEYKQWAVVTLRLWNEDPRLHADFARSCPISRETGCAVKGGGPQRE